MKTSIPREVARQLGYYVYLYVDPHSNEPFYVGKGCGCRVLKHLSVDGDSRMAQKLKELRAAGLEPRIEILAHRLANEETALRIEAAVIDLLGLPNLAQKRHGWRSVHLGRIPLSDLVPYYAAKPVQVTHAVLLIRINRLYRHGMSDDELYEATRGVWKLGRRRSAAKYALAVFEAVVREVYEIHTWHPAGSTPYKSRVKKDLCLPGRCEFLGCKAEERIRRRYVGRSVAHHFSPGLRSPVVYVNVTNAK